MKTALPLTVADIYDAADRLHAAARITPVISSPLLNQLLGGTVVCKTEALQRTGSFKFRGAYNAISVLTQPERRRGVIGASSGNHAQALALAGRLLHVPVTVVIPSDAPKMKIHGARSLGANIVTYDRGKDNRDKITADIAAAQGFTVVPSANATAVMAGAATVALEFFRQAPEMNAILVPVGGGGLAAGTAVITRSLCSHVRVIGVEPEAAGETAASLRSGHMVRLADVPDTIADGLRHTSPAELPWQVNKELLDDVITVTDGQIVQAMRWAFEYLKIVVEPSGATALAALGSDGVPGHTVGAVLSGGSIDVDTFHTLTSSFSPVEEHTDA